MTIATVTNSLRQLLDRATPNQLSTFLQILQSGSVMRSTTVALRRCNPNAAVTNPYIPGVACQSVAETITGSSPAASPGANLLGQLPDDAKCAYILRATALAGTTTAAELTVNTTAQNATAFATGAPGVLTGNIGVSPSGDIAVCAADAWTSVDVLYVPEQVDVIELTLTPATGIVTLPALCNLPGATATTPATVLLMEAEILTGTVTGKCAVLPPATAAPGATKQACLNLAKTLVDFKVSDAPTSVRLKLGLAKTCSGGVNVNQLLEAIAPVF